MLVGKAQGIELEHVPMGPGTNAKAPIVIEVDQTKDIEKLECNNMSIMPAGFEALPPSDLSALIEYLCSISAKPGI